MFDQHDDEGMLDEELDDLVTYFLGNSGEPSSHSPIQFFRYPSPKLYTMYYGDGFLDIWIDALSSSHLQKANEMLEFVFDPSLPNETGKCDTGKYTYIISRGSCIRELTPTAIADARLAHVLNFLDQKGYSANDCPQ